MSSTYTLWEKRGLKNYTCCEQDVKLLCNSNFEKRLRRKATKQNRWRNGPRKIPYERRNDRGWKTREKSLTNGETTGGGKRVRGISNDTFLTSFLPIWQVCGNLDFFQNSKKLAKLCFGYFRSASLASFWKVRFAISLSRLRDVLTPQSIPDTVPNTFRCSRWSAHFSSVFLKRAAKPRLGRSPSQY